MEERESRGARESRRGQAVAILEKSDRERRLRCRKKEAAAIQRRPRLRDKKAPQQALKCYENNTTYLASKSSFSCAITGTIGSNNNRDSMKA